MKKFGNVRKNAYLCTVKIKGMGADPECDLTSEIHTLIMWGAPLDGRNSG
jgi:hypothetical protein